MITIEIGENEEDKIHHKDINFEWYLLALFLLKISYIILFYDNFSDFFIILYYLVIIGLFIFLIRGRQRKIAIISHLIGYVAYFEFISYFFISSSYYGTTRILINKDEIEQATGGIVIIMMLIIFLIFNIMTLCFFFWQIKKKYIAVGIMTILISIWTHLYTIKIIYDNLIKNNDKIFNSTHNNIK